MIFLRSLDNECKAMPSAASRLPRSRLEKPRSREPSQPALSHELIKNFTKDLEVRWDLGNRASPVNRALACSRRSDSSHSRAREKNSRRKKERGETRGGKGERVLALSLSGVQLNSLPSYHRATSEREQANRANVKRPVHTKEHQAPVVQKVYPRDKSLFTG